MATNQTQPNNTPDSTKSKRLRSPSYPGINLETAIKRADGFYKKERRNAAPYSVAVSHWGFGAKSSGGLVTVAAMRSFGLLKRVERAPGGRPVQLSDLALQILLDERPDSSERAAAIKKAALMPKIHADLWQKYGTTEEVSDPNLKHDLVFRLKFNENTVDEVIKEYKETIAYAKLTSSDKLSLSLEDKDEADEEEEEPEVPEAQQFQTPTKQPLIPAGKLPLERPPATATRQDVFSLNEGIVSIQWPASISPDSYEDLAAWLDILKRKIGRSVEQKGKTDAKDTQES